MCCDTLELNTSPEIEPLRYQMLHG
jgi:hypothetical protein